MLAYYVLYRTDEQTAPAGILAMEPRNGHALMWDHRQRAWAYSPRLAVRFLDDPRNIDRYREVDRAEAVSVAQEVTGGVGLPDEDVILLAFEKGMTEGSCLSAP